ncbi:hypothetical protein DE146DRAFT_602958 [Phaeosphaeria sp. MPI-PUGE-AT-0046c]|nr:hypothetical protein DE146DRAFT_602958 [Phaeosphaeria sp. MPI-PUGE-AT-0046c]
MPNISFTGAKKRKTRHSGYVFKMSRPELDYTTPAPSGLLSLVDELLLNIIDHIDNRESLVTLASTCMRFQSLVEPYIWRDLLVLTGHHARNISQALDDSERRVGYVQSLSVRYQDKHREGIEELNFFISLMARLKHLTIESPCPNNLEWRAGHYFDGYSRIDYANLLAQAVYPRAGVPIALPMLQTLSLHGHGSGDQKFLLGRAKAMFFHPSLRKITLSCLNLEGEMDNDLLKEKRKATPLQSLTLIECNVDIEFLDRVLSLPRALRELSVGERLHVFDCKPSLDPKKRTSSTLFLTALQQQADSLKRLVHIGGQLALMPRPERDPQGPAKLRSLTSLEHLELGLESHLNYSLRNNGFPPSLKSLKILDAAVSLSAMHDPHDPESMAETPLRSITSLLTDCMPSSVQPDFTIHLHFSDHALFRFIVATHPTTANRFLSTKILDRNAMYKIATLLKSYNGRFIVSREIFRSGTSYIPPYMYGEEEPDEELMYDSNDYWRVTGIDYQLMDDDQLRAKMIKDNTLKRCRECTLNSRSFDECRSTGDGSPCLVCNREQMVCRWSWNKAENEDSDDDDDDEDEELDRDEVDAAEALLQQILWH